MKLIQQLSDGAWHSGQALAQRLGVSRTAIWKQVERARSMGVEIQAVRGRGYRLAQPFEALDEQAIRHTLSGPGRAAVDRLEVLSSVDSTNTYLNDAHTHCDCHVCFAEYQTGGRGRRGRRWVSPYGTNLYVSVAWRYVQAPPALGALGLAAGVELAECLHALGVAGVQLKWPNDSLIGGKKLAGMLLEHRGETAVGCRVVVGVGINVSMSPDHAVMVGQPWTRVADHVPALPDRNAMAAAVLDALLRALQRFGRDGFSPDYRARWRRLDAAAGQPVCLQTAGQRIRGRATGVADDGALLVDVDGEIRRFYAGDLSLRIVRD